MAKLQIKLIKSFAGKQKSQVATAKSLGLKRIGDISVQEDNGPTRGKIHKISHMVDVTEA